MKKEDKYIARIQFKLKVLQSKGQTFEDFFVSVMTKADKDFQPVKAYGNIGDQKNDGFNKKTGTYYQVFAPEDITKDKTIYDAAKKLEQDFRGLYEKWNNLCQIKNYFFVVNDKYEGVDPIITKKILELNKEFSEVDIEAMCEHQHIAFIQVWFNVFFVHICLQLIVDQNHNDVCLFCSFCCCIYF